MLSEQQIKAGIEKNHRALDNALSNQLTWNYKRVIPTGNFVRYIFAAPLAAKQYLIEYMLLSIPPNANENDLWMVAYDDSGNVKFVSENLRRGIYGAQISNFTSPTALKPYKGMMPIMLKVLGDQTLTFDFRGPILSTLAYLDVLICGHQKNRVTSGGYDGSL